MKFQSTLRRSLLLCASAILVSSAAQADTLYWDGTSSDGNANGGLGSWTNGGTTNWDTLAVGGTDISWTNGAHTAVFGGTAATVTIGAGGVTVGGLTFNTSGYTIAAGANGLTFSTGTNKIWLSAGLNGSPTAIISGKVGGSGADLVFVGNPGATSTSVTFSGASATGWTGATTINSGVTLAVDGASANLALGSTSAINLNGGSITTGGGVTSANSAVNYFNDSADIAVNGGGSITYRPINAGPTYSETLGDVTVYSGQMSFLTGTLSSGSATVVIPTLTRDSATTVLSFSTGNGGAIAASGSINNIQVSGSGTTTGWTSGANNNSIVGPWMTTGTTGTTIDYAVYSGNNVVSANTIASGESNWTDNTKQYTLAIPGATAVGPAHALGATRTVTALRATSTLTTVTANTVNGSPNFTLAGHNFAVGDVVTLGTVPNGFTAGQVYYVASVVPGTSFTLSATPGGAAINATNAVAATVAGGLKLDSGRNLRTDGILNGGTSPLAIGRTAAGGDLSSATSGATNLYLTTIAGAMTVDAPIVDNGGALTLVKSGAGTLTIAGTNTYGGGTVVNAGTLTFRTAGSWVSNQDITFGGTGSLTASVGALSGDTLDVKQGATGSITGSSSITFATTTGAGQIIYGGGSSATLALGNASGFTGNAVVSVGIGGTNPYPTMSFTNIADTAGSFIGWGANGQGDGNQKSFIALTGNAGLLTFDERQIAILGRTGGNNSTRSAVLLNNRATGSNAWVINTDLINNADRNGVGFILDGSNADDNTFDGAIGNSTIGAYAALNVYKNGAGKWILSGDNTFTGRLIVGQGTLSVGTMNESSAAGPLGKGSVIQLGGDERGVAGTNINVILGTNNSGTLEYTGGTVVSTRTGFLIGDTNASGTGGGTIANNGSGAITFSAGTFNNTQAGITATRTLTLGGNYAGAANDIQGVIQDNNGTTGKVALVKADGGKWILSNTNTFTGGTTVSGGTLVLTGNNTLSPTTGNLSIGTATLQLQANVGNTTLGVSSALGYVTGSSAGNANPGITTTGTATFQLRSDSSVTFGGTSGIAGLSSRTINIDVANNGSGSGNTITFSPDGNVYGGSVTVNITGSNGYSLALGDWNSNGTTGTLTFNPTTANVSVGNLAANSGPPTRTVALDGTATGNTIGAIAPATYSVTKSNTGTWVINGASAYAQATNVIQGSLGIGNDLAFGGSTLNIGGPSSNTPTIFASGGARSIANNTVLLQTSLGGNPTIAGSNDLEITGTTTASGAARTLSVNNSGLTTLTGNVFLSNDDTTSGRGLTINGTGNTVISGVIANNNAGNTLAATLTKDGAGTLELTNINTYTGATGVIGGNLLINGDNSAATGAVTVGTGATLGGFGNVGGNTTIQGGGFHAPGDGITNQDFSGDLTYDSTSTFRWQIDTASDTNDTVTGSLANTLSGSGAIFNISSSTSYSDGFWSTNKSFTDVFADFGTSAAWNSIFSSITGAGLTWNGSQAVASGGGYFTLSASSLDWTAIPEPSTALGGLLLTAGLLRRRRKLA